MEQTHKWQKQGKETPHVEYSEDVAGWGRSNVPSVGFMVPLKNTQPKPAKLVPFQRKTCIKKSDQMYFH
jgi:hypothetical protein